MVRNAMWPKVRSIRSAMGEMVVVLGCAATHGGVEELREMVDNIVMIGVRGGLDRSGSVVYGLLCGSGRKRMTHAPEGASASFPRPS